MLDGRPSTYTTMHYIPMCLYGYIAIRLCVYSIHPWGVLFPAWLLDSRRGGCCLTQVMFVRGGDGALARTRAVAPGFAGDGAVVCWEVPSTPGVPTHSHWLYVSPCVACEGAGFRRRRRVGFLFVCLFGVFLFMSLVFSLLGWHQVRSCLFGLRMRVCG